MSDAVAWAHLVDIWSYRLEKAFSFKILIHSCIVFTAFQTVNSFTCIAVKEGIFIQ